MIPMPSYEPLPLNTKGQSWLVKQKRIFVDRRAYRINRDFYYEDEYGQVFLIPNGFICDFASSPRFSWLFGLDPKGVLLIPSLLHDWGYRHDFYLDENGDKFLIGVGRSYHDWKMRRNTMHINDVTGLAYVGWGAVRVGGFMAWQRNKKYHDGEIHLVGKYGYLLEDAPVL